MWAASVGSITRRLGEVRQVTATVAENSLVGRAPERTVLEAALVRLRAGGGGLTLISGETGVGKTRLVEEVVRLVAR
jgi:MoxR-like ATPase